MSWKWPGLHWFHSKIHSIHSTQFYCKTLLLKLVKSRQFLQCTKCALSFKFFHSINGLLTPLQERNFHTSWETVQFSGAVNITFENHCHFPTMPQTNRNVLVSDSVLSVSNVQSFRDPVVLCLPCSWEPIKPVATNVLSMYLTDQSCSCQLFSHRSAFKPNYDTTINSFPLLLPFK